MEKSAAEQVVAFAYSMRDDGLYSRPRDSEIAAFGGRLVSSSNDGEAVISFSPTDVWEFVDGSRAEITWSDATVLV